MPLIEETGRVHWLITAEAPPALTRRRPYTPPTSTYVGTVEELLVLRAVFIEHLPSLVRLAQESGRPFSSLGDYVARTNQMCKDLAAVAQMIRALGVKSREIA
jgi:hypothetical protein